MSNKMKKAMDLVRRKMEAIVPDEIKQPENMRKYGQMVADMIRLRTRLGDGVAFEGASKKELKPLSPKYIEQRRELQEDVESSILTKRFSQAKNKNKVKLGVSKNDIHEHGGLSPATTPAKSNLTRTGQLLDSEAVKSVSTGRVTVGPTGTRTDGRKKELTNAQVAEYVSKARPYNHLSGTEIKRVNDQVKRDVRALIKSRLTKTK